VHALFVAEYFQQHQQLPNLTSRVHLQAGALPHQHPLEERKQNVLVGMQQLHEQTIVYLWPPSLHEKLRTQQLLQMKLTVHLAPPCMLLASST
jgi:hypothetical protein